MRRVRESWWVVVVREDVCEACVVKSGCGGALENAKLVEMSTGYADVHVRSP